MIRIGISSFLLLISFLGCESPDRKSSQSRLMDIPNLELHSIDEESDTVQLTKNNSYGNLEEVFFRSMRDFTVDGNGKVYIADAGSGSNKVHVFNASGDLLRSFGGEGRGPREFMGLCCLKATNGKLHIYDYRQFKINVYNTNPVTYLNTYSVNPTDLAISDKTKILSHSYYVLPDSTYLVGFSEVPVRGHQERRYTNYYRANENWKINSNVLFQQLLLKEIWGMYRGIEVFQRFPFFEKSLMAVSKSGHIYRAQTDSFLIKKHDNEGNYLEGFYYPYQRVSVSREDALNTTNKMTRNIAEDVDLPNYWPVLNSMQFDDKNRLWISTIINSREKLQWWVLDSDGELIARFRWPGKRAKQAYGLEPDIVVRNDFFYVQEKDKSTGKRRVVKYRINIKYR